MDALAPERNSGAGMKAAEMLGTACCDEWGNEKRMRKVSNVKERRG